MVKKVVLLLGGNLGNTRKIFSEATDILASGLGKITARSALYRSGAWGYHSDNLFLNRVLIFETDLDEKKIIKICLETEEKLGRKRPAGSDYADRLIDIDILYFGKRVINTPELTVPHPKLQERRFAMLPLTELIPEFIHPVLKKSQKTLLSLCPDKSHVEKL